MVVELFPLKFSDRIFCILSNERQCAVRIEEVSLPLNQGHMT